MGKVTASITTSVDGFVTGPDDGPEYGLGKGGERLHYWVMGGPWTYDGGHNFAMHYPRQGFLRRDRGRFASVGPHGMYDAAGAWEGTDPFAGTAFRARQCKTLIATEAWSPVHCDALRSLSYLDRERQFP